MNKQEVFFEGDLKYIDYFFYDNQIRAFYDKNDSLVFVLDCTISDIKPNVLLVINSVGDRKWDNILANDYNVELENIRPKENNKYQKLDISYNGLDVYNELLDKYQEGVNLDNYLLKLEYFRHSAVIKNATERLIISQDIINKTTKTIETTERKIKEYEDLIKSQKEKIKELKKDDSAKGKEKKEKLQTRIEKTDSLLKRSNRRLKRAKARLNVAENDISIVNNLITEINTRELKMPNINEEEVKPLLDKEPQFDENIAFKEPENFDKKNDDSEENDDFKNLMNDILNSKDDEDFEEAKPKDDDNSNAIKELEKLQQELKDIKLINEKLIYDNKNLKESLTKIEAEKKELEERGPIVIEKPVISSIEHNSDNNKTEVPKQPVILYYCMLIALIFLSVFSLFMYQKKFATVKTPNIVDVVKKESVVPDELNETQQPVIEEVKIEKPDVKAEEVEEQNSVENTDETLEQNTNEKVENAPEEVIPTLPLDNGNKNIEENKQQEDNSDSIINITTPDIKPVETEEPVTVQTINKPEYGVSQDIEVLKDSNNTDFEKTNSDIIVEPTNKNNTVSYE